MGKSSKNVGSDNAVSENGEHEGSKSASAQANVSCLNDVIRYFQGLNNQVGEANANEKKGEKPLSEDNHLPTVSHYFWTGHLYRGQHRDALSGFSKKTPEEKEFAKLAIALIERIAQIAPEKLKELKIDPQADEKAQQAFVDQLYSIYGEVAKEHYDALSKNVEGIVEHLNRHYASHKDNKLDSVADQAKAIQGYVRLVLQGKDLTAAKKALKEEGEEKNGDTSSLEAQFKDHLKQIKSEKEELKRQLHEDFKVNVGQLTYDAQYYATQLGKHKDKLDKQFRDFKKDINRVAQKIGTHEKRLKHRSLEDLLKNPWGPSYEDFQQDAPSEPVSKDKQERRNIKKTILNIALTVAVLLGFGESVVAAVGIATFSLTGAWLVIIPTIVFCSAFYANYSLVFRDTYDTLKGIWEGQTFRDKDGKPVHWISKIIMVIAGITFSFCSGMAYAALSAKCLLPVASAFLTHLLPVAFAGTVAPALAFLATGMIGLATSIGLGIIFFVQVSNFIRDRKWKGIAAYLKKEFWWDDHLSEEATWMETFKHWVGNALKAIKLALSLSTTLLITYISFGLFAGKIGGWMGMIPGMAGNVANVITQVLTWGNALVMSTFGISKNQANFDNLTPSGLTVAAFEFGLGAAAIPFLVLETALRCITWRQEWAPVWTGIALNGVCSVFESVVGGASSYVSSYFQDWMSPTFSPEIAFKEKENKNVAEPIKEVLSSHANILQRFLNKIGLGANSFGQVGMFMGAGLEALTSTVGRTGAMIATAASKFPFSFGPNYFETVKEQQNNEVKLSEHTIDVPKNAGPG
jgi:hypothetical protein